MDIEKLIERLKCPQIHSCPTDGEYPSCKMCQKDIKQESATALSKLQTENKKLRETVDKYATAARVIALYLKPSCDESLPYDEMIADAARKVSAELEQVKRERDAAVDDLSNRPHRTTCKHGERCDYISVITGMPDCHACEEWEWRGPQKEE